MAIKREYFLDGNLFSVRGMANCILFHYEKAHISMQGIVGFIYDGEDIHCTVTSISNIGVTAIVIILGKLIEVKLKFIHCDKPSIVINKYKR